MKQKMTIEKLIRDGILDIREGKAPEEKKKKKKQLHLNIPRIDTLFRYLKGPFIPSPLVTEIKAVAELIRNMFLLGVAGGLSLSLLLLLYPFKMDIPIVGLIKSNLALEVIIVVFGSGALLYIIYDFIELLKKEKKKVER